MDEHIRKGSSIAVGGALAWEVHEAVNDDLATITVTLREQIERAPYVHLTGFIFDTAVHGLLADPWTAKRPSEALSMTAPKST